MTDSTPLDARQPADVRQGSSKSAPETDEHRTPGVPGLHKAALEALFHSHANKLKAYYRRSGLDDGAAEDLAQDVFVRALRGLDQFRGGSKLSTWLWTIAQNLLLEHRRKRVLDIEEVEGVPLDVDTLTVQPAPRLMETGDCVRRGFAAFSKEHPERAKVIFLAMVEEFTRDELAEFLGRSTRAATEYLSQCKSKFKPYIQHCHDE